MQVACTTSDAALHGLGASPLAGCLLWREELGRSLLTDLLHLDEPSSRRPRRPRLAILATVLLGALLS